MGDSVSAIALLLEQNAEYSPFMAEVIDRDNVRIIDRDGQPVAYCRRDVWVALGAEVARKEASTVNAR